MKRTWMMFPLTAAALGALALWSGAAGTQPTVAAAPVAPTAPAALPTVPLPTGPGVPGEPVRATGAGPVTLEAQLASPYVLAGSTEVHAVFRLQTAPSAPLTRQPVNLAVVIDRSGSMAGPKLAFAKQAAASLVDQLQPTDRLAVVQYGEDVVSMRGTLATRQGKAQLHAFIDNIACSGSTDIGLALKTAADLVADNASGYRSNRIILLTDGQPTAGIVDPEALERLTAQIHERGMAVTALGVGLDFNETLLREMAENGAGFYGFLEDGSRLEEIFAKELHQAAAAVARNVRVQLTLPPGVELIDILGRPSSVFGRTVTTTLTDQAAEQSAHFVARLRVTAPRGVAAVQLARAELLYTDVTADVPRSAALELMAKVTAKQEEVQASTDREVESRSLQALGAREIQRASEEFRQGNRQGALSRMEGLRSLFGASGNALAGQTRDIEEARRQMAAATTPEEMARVRMSTNSRNVRNFGESLDAY
jgi:Ca-activated chloride channel family protein